MSRRRRPAGDPERPHVEVEPDRRPLFRGPAGETDAALEHLAAALRGRPAFVADACEDPDLASLRGLQRFAELVREA